MIEYDTPTTVAFKQLGALSPVQQWSSFDVPPADARKGKASVLVTTIWNAHGVATSLAISRDRRDGTLWYRVGKPERDAPSNATAHWRRIALAKKFDIPIIGLLKDYKTHRCSMHDTFQCIEVREDLSGDAVWLALQPNRSLTVPVGEVNILERTGRMSDFQKSSDMVKDKVGITEADMLLRVTRNSFLNDAKRRRAIELHAMAAAIIHFRQQWSVVKDVSAKESYDLLCCENARELRVEVKGTTTHGLQVILTRNEVENAPDPRNYVALFVLHDIKINSNDICSGGTENIIQPWTPILDNLKPIAYEYIVDGAA